MPARAWARLGLQLLLKLVWGGGYSRWFTQPVVQAGECPALGQAGRRHSEGGRAGKSPTRKRGELDREPADDPTNNRAFHTLREQTRTGLGGLSLSHPPCFPAPCRSQALSGRGTLGNKAAPPVLPARCPVRMRLRVHMRVRAGVAVVPARAAVG